MKVDVDFVEVWLMIKYGVMEGTEKYSEFLSFLDSSNPDHLRVVGGSLVKPYERGQSANSLDGWRVELPQGKGGINDKRNK